MAKERPVPSGDRNPATARDRQAAPAGPQHPPREAGARRQVAAGPSDPRPIPAPFLRNVPPALSPSLELYPHLRGAPLQGPSTRERAMARRRRQPGQAERPMREGRAENPMRAAEHSMQERPAEHSMREAEGPQRVAAGLGEVPDRPTPAPHPYLSESASDFAAAEQFPVPTAGSGPTSLSGPIDGTEVTFTPGPATEAPGPAPRVEDAYDPDKTGDFGLVDNAMRPTVAPVQSTGRTSAASVLAGAAAARPRKTPVAQQRTNRPGHQRFPSPPGERERHQRAAAGATRRPEPARVPVPRPVLPGLQLQPMVHVTDMAAAVAFYEMLGGEINHGDRDGDWVLMQVGVSQIGLVSRPADAEQGENTVELNFSATMPLDRLEHLLRAHGIEIVRMAPDPDLGVQLHVETPDGMPIKIHQVEPDLLV